MRRITTDRYGRTVAELLVDGVNAGRDLVSNRYAEIYWKYAGRYSWTRQFESLRPPEIHILLSQKYQLKQPKTNR